MPRRLWLCLCLLGVCLAAPAGAATETKNAPVRKPAATAGKTTARKAAAPAGATAKRPDAPAAATAKPAEAPVASRTVAAPRKLEDIHIEGEIPAPQVLFVTARDQRRFTKFHHDRYLKTSVQVGEGTPLPTRIALTRRPTTPAGAP